MAAINVETICNMALTLLGADRITSISDTTDKNSRECNAVYELMRDDVLTDHAWSFAQKRIALVEAADPDPVWTDDFVTVAYDLPTDFLQLNSVNVKGALVKLEGSQLLSNTSDLEMLYTFRLTDVTKFQSKFVQALAGRIAGEMAMAITGKSTTMERLLTIYYEKKLPQAISKDSQQGTPQAPAQNEWLNARRQGAGGELVGQTGWDTWYPPCWC